MPRCSSERRPACLSSRSQHHALAVTAGDGRDAHVHGAPGEPERNASVLGQALLGDVEARHDLDARDDERCDGAAGFQYLAQHAVHAHAHDQKILEGFDVDVGGVFAHRLAEQCIDERMIGASSSASSRSSGSGS